MTHQGSVAGKRRCTTRRLAVLVILALAGFQSSAEADEAARKAYDAVKEGNQLLAEEKFVEALKAYDKAAALSPDSPQVAYNRGLALYRLGKFEEARRAFQDAIKPSHPEIEARAKYNLGRTAHAEAMEHASEPKQAIEDLSRAINFYQDALRLDPKQTDPDAQKNLSLAERLRTYFQKRLEQQPPQPQPSSQPSSQPQDQQPQPTTSRSQTSQPGSQPTSEKSESADESEKNEQESQEGSEGQEQNQDGEQDESESQKGSDQKESEPQKQRSADGQEGSDQASGQQDEKQREQEASANPEQKADRDDKLREEEIQPMLQEARDAEKARREARRMKMMRQRGRTAVPKDW